MCSYVDKHLINAVLSHCRRKNGVPFDKLYTQLFSCNEPSKYIEVELNLCVLRDK